MAKEKADATTEQETQQAPEATEEGQTAQAATAATGQQETPQSTPAPPPASDATHITDAAVQPTQQAAPAQGLPNDGFGGVETAREWNYRQRIDRMREENQRLLQDLDNVRETLTIEREKSAQAQATAEAAESRRKQAELLADLAPRVAEGTARWAAQEVERAPDRYLFPNGQVNTETLLEDHPLLRPDSSHIPIDRTSPNRQGMRFSGPRDLADAVRQEMTEMDKHYKSHGVQIYRPGTKPVGDTTAT